VPFFAHWGKYGHDSARLSGAKNHAFDVRLREPLLAFARAGPNGRPGVDPTGYVNSALEWSSPANDFDPASTTDDFLDLERGCAFNARLVRGTPAEFRPDDQTARTAADITPRRLQRFRPKPGAKYAWRALAPAAAGGEFVKLAAGTVTADERGLVTLPQVPILKAGLGVRVIIQTPESAPQSPAETE
jgi:hypothetical protein